MLACERKDLEIARLLLGCGAWTKPRDSRHFSALDYATFPIPLTHPPEVPQLLVELLSNPKVSGRSVVGQWSVSQWNLGQWNLGQWSVSGLPAGPLPPGMSHRLVGLSAMRSGTNPQMILWKALVTHPSYSKSL